MDVLLIRHHSPLMAERISTVATPDALAVARPDSVSGYLLVIDVIFLNDTNKGRLSSNARRENRFIV